MRALAGRLAVGILNVLGRLPTGAALALGTALLPLYVPFRVRTRRRLRSLHPPVGALAYYRMRLRLALLSLRHLRGLPDGLARAVGGEAHYRAALESGRPVVLVGWHQGPVELLHRIPAEAAPHNPFFVMTAGAFAPALAGLMRAGRSGPGKSALTPGDRAGLRRWARARGVLALMIDQVPGEADAWLDACGGSVRLPWPARLVEWLRARDAVWLAVETRWRPGNRVSFDYRVLKEEGRRAEIARLVTDGLRASADQYNWSYGKIGVEDSRK
jgi:lauroyl/myristoyl acyltransferase